MGTGLKYDHLLVKLFHLKVSKAEAQSCFNKNYQGSLTLIQNFHLIMNIKNAICVILYNV